MQHIFREDDNFLYAWKPRGIPSTFGKQTSFLETLFFSHIQNTTLQQQIKKLSYLFSQQDEYGLLNRLDNETGGRLYFAKTPKIKDHYKKLQSIGKTDKIYIADVYGKLNLQEMRIDTPIAHHRFKNDRMVVVRDIVKDKNKIYGKLHKVVTSVKVLYHNEVTNVSKLEIHIQKGIRHQIRVHLASIGHPIIGDNLYNKQEKSNNKLHLWSVGLTILN